MNTQLIGQLLMSLLLGVWPGLLPETSRSQSPLTPALVEATREFQVDPFDQIKISETLTVTIKEGSAFTVKATGRPEDINTLTASVKKGQLIMAYEPVRTKKNQDIVINRDVVNVSITLPVLKQAEFQKAAQFTVGEFDTGKSLALVLNSLASGSVNVHAENVKLTLDSRSSLTLQGEAAFLEATLQGQSTLTAFDLKTKEAVLQLNGMSKANVSVANKLQAAASGSSEVIYKGKPDVKTAQNDFSFVRAYTR